LDLEYELKGRLLIVRYYFPSSNLDSSKYLLIQNGTQQDCSLNSCYHSHWNWYHSMLPTWVLGTIYGYQTRYQTSNVNCSCVSRRELHVCEGLMKSSWNVSIYVSWLQRILVIDLIFP